MLGFFSDREIREASGGMIEQTSDGPLCNECNLFRSCRSPKMPFTGKGKKKILIVAEAPGETEDQLNKQLVGKVGQFFSQKLAENGIDIDEDCWKINSTNCRPTDAKGNNREPTNNEIDCCKPYVMSIVKQLQPLSILIVGDAACRTFFGSYFKDTSIGRFRGLKIPDRNLKAWLLPIYHPSYPMRNPKDDLLQSFYDLELRSAISYANYNTNFNVVPADPEKQSSNLYKFDDVKALLNRVLDFGVEYFFFDYEATGLKPDRPGHKLLSASCAFRESDYLKAFSFPYEYRHHFDAVQRVQIKKLWRRIMQDEKIKKVAHNKKYEYRWTYKMMGTEVRNFHWCTMNNAHILDDRKKFTGLKFQTYIQFGVPPYDNHIEPYRNTSKGEEFNRMEEVDLEDLLEYGGLDSYWGYSLFELQKHFQMTPELRRAQQFFDRSQDVMCKMTEVGVRSDLAYYETEDAKISAEIETLKQLIAESNEARFFERRQGRSIKISKNVSDDDLRTLLYDYLQLEPIKTTESERPSVDEEALEHIELPFVKNTVRLRKLNKIKGTYFGQFLRETYDQLIHTWLNLHIPRSFRSSSSDPNLHNVPRREELAKKLCRSGIYPRENDRFFLFADVKAGEVCVAAMYSKDPNLVYYIKTPGTDMHRDQSEEIWRIPEEEVDKEIRFYTKNCFVFPEFYGDYYGNCASALWKNCIFRNLKSGKPVKQHLIDIGMIPKDNQTMQFRAFEDHMKFVEERFWNKFGQLKEWQKGIIADYKKTGYVYLKHGFRRGGYLKKNEIGNTPIQGCLQGGVLVQTKEGWIPIRELVGKQVQVWTGFKWADATGVNRGECQLAIIELESGLEVHCDTRHKLKNHRNEWVDFRDLKEGDYVALPKTRNDKILPRDEITWPFVLGFIIGDGSFCSHLNPHGTIPQYSLSIYGGEVKKNDLQRIQQFLIKEGFNARIRVVDGKNSDKYILSVTQNKIADILGQNGIGCNLTAKTKKIPEKVWGMSEQDQADFLNGLWLSDGSRSDKSLHMSNYELLKDVQILAYGLGYDSFFAPTKDGYKLEFRQVPRRGFEFRGNSNRIYPAETVKLLMKGREYKTTKNRTNEQIANARAVKSGNDIRQSTAERIIKEVAPSFEIYRYDRIKRIDILNEKEETFTMTVNDSLHQFVADGVIQKNTLFHLVCEVMNYMDDVIVKQGLSSDLCLQIHDEVIFSAVPEDFPALSHYLQECVNTYLPDKFDWINVPLTLEPEASPLNGSWYGKTEIGWDGRVVKKDHKLYGKEIWS